MIDRATLASLEPRRIALTRHEDNRVTVDDWSRVAWFTDALLTNENLIAEIIQYDRAAKSVTLTAANGKATYHIFDYDPERQVHKAVLVKAELDLPDAGR